MNAAQQSPASSRLLPGIAVMLTTVMVIMDMTIVSDSPFRDLSYAGFVVAGRGGSCFSSKAISRASWATEPLMAAATSAYASIPVGSVITVLPERITLPSSPPLRMYQRATSTALLSVPTSKRSASTTT
jgi:hypothetical protein